MSKTAYADYRGVTIAAVSKWLERRHIDGDAVTPDGRIVVEIADRQLAERLDHSRSLGALANQPSGDDAHEPRPTGTIDRMQALRLEQLERQIQRDREADLVRRGVYLRADAVRREEIGAVTLLVAAIDNWLPDMIEAAFGGDREVLARARQEWRKFRARQAGEARARAAELPEHVLDHSARLRLVEGPTDPAGDADVSRRHADGDK